jgi:hypothetical protein
MRRLDSCPVILAKLVQLSETSPDAVSEGLELARAIIGPRADDIRLAAESPGKTVRFPQSQPLELPPAVSLHPDGWHHTLRHAGSRAHTFGARRREWLGHD